LRRHAYVLPLDVRQFFPSIDHALVLANLGCTLGDPKALALCRLILASGEGVLQEEYDMIYFAGADLFAVNRPRGLPIGNLTSQFWANVYLNPVDHFVKRRLRALGFVRYVDDMLLFGDSKAELPSWRQALINRLGDLRLTVHNNKGASLKIGAGHRFGQTLNAGRAHRFFPKKIGPFGTNFSRLLGQRVETMPGMHV
jgi:RNA-directed DNA polymerase